ncbi:MAG: APC family permease [Thermaerobacter sp.]|nr:APC family permease [Thermaerobacter sp.]
MAAVVLFIGVPWLLGVLGIRPTIKVLAFTSLTEIVFLIGAALVIMAKVHTPHPWTPLEIGVTGYKGVAMGMIFAITSFIGVGSHAPLGEEAKGVRTQRGRLIGKAALVSLALVGAVLTRSAYALTVGWGPAQMGAFATADAPGVTVFLHDLGPVGAVALVVLAVNSAFTDCLALLTSSARVLYAIGRDQLLGTHFGIVNGCHAPAEAVTALASLAAAAGIAAGLWLGPVNAFDVITTAVLFGLATAHTLMNVSLMRLYAHEHGGVRHVLQHFVLPVAATALFWWVLYESVWPISSPLSWSLAVWFSVLAGALVCIWRIGGRLDYVDGHRLGVSG